MPSDRVSQKCPVSIPFYEVKVESRKGNIFKFTNTWKAVSESDECIDIYRDIMHDDQMVTIVWDAHIGRTDPQGSKQDLDENE